MLAGCSSGGDGGAVNELTADVETLEMDLASARAELATTKADLEDTEDDLATAQAALATARTTLSTTRADLTAAQAELTTAKDDLEEAESDLEDAQTELATAKSDLETANATLTTLRSTQTTTQADLVAARASLATAQAALQTARATLATRTTELTAAQTQVTQLTATVTSLRTQLGQAQDTTEDLQEEITELETETTSLDQNTRALGMRSVLLPVTPADQSEVSTTSRVTVPVPSRGSISIQGPTGYTSSGISNVPSGFRAARLSRAVGGSQLEIVAYTDREVSRPLLDHYGDMRPSATDVVLDMESSDWPADSVGITATATPDVKATRGPRVVTHGFPATKSVEAQGLATSNALTTEGTAALAPTAAANMKSAVRYSGNIHGVGGTFQCSVADCDITLAATYVAPATIPDSATQVTATLSQVTMDTEEADAMVYFRPSSATGLVYLYRGGATAGSANPDGQYMTFGWWRNTPAISTGTYDFEAFAFASAEVAFGPGNATYDGPAVGAYVEEGLLTGDTGGARYGEFTATAHLNGVATAVTGYVDGFQATQAGSSTAVTKSWRVNLLDGGAANLGTLGGEGSWDVRGVANHTHSRATQPLAAVGTFAAGTADLLHVTGAFGAHRRTTDQTE